MTPAELARIPDDDLGRQIVLALAHAATTQGPPYNSPICNLGWDVLKSYASQAEISRQSEIWSAMVEDAIRYMARCDADSLGVDNPPAFEDSVEVWTEVDPDSDEDRPVVQALRLLGERTAAQLYRAEWRRIWAGL